MAKRTTRPSSEDNTLPQGFRTRSIHSGIERDAETRSVAQPIYPTTVYAREPRKSNLPLLYSRYQNPNRATFEEALADLEGGAAALAFASGSAAITAILNTLPHGSHSIFPKDYYMGTRRILWELFADKLLWQEVPMRDPARVRRAITPSTRIVWVESPSNPSLDIIDIQALADIAHEAGALLVVDNTWPTPVIQRPFEHGADVVVHSVSKYIGGHSDLLMGALVFRETGDFHQACFNQQYLGGGVPSPQDCWLARRGLMTMPLRVQAHCENALAVARFLDSREDFAQVFYPGLLKGRELKTAKRQMSALGGKPLYGGMVSFRLAGGEKAAKALVRKTRLIVNTTSLGGVESMMEQRRASEGPDSTTPPDLIRLSVGIEDVSDIIADLEQALDAIR